MVVVAVKELILQHQMSLKNQVAVVFEMVVTLNLSVVFHTDCCY